MKLVRSLPWAALVLFVAGCSKPERHNADAGVSSPTAESSDEALDPDGFPDVNEGQKLIMAGFGKIVVDAGFQDTDVGFKAPDGMTLDASYVRKIDDLPVGKFTVTHREAPGSDVVDPRIEDFGEKTAVAAPCPAQLGGPATKAGEVAKKDFVRGVTAHYQCARLSFGGGLISTIRKDERIYELMCVASSESAITECIAILRQYRPS